MKVRSQSGLLFTCMLLLLVAGSGMAGTPQTPGDAATVGESPSSAANARWFNQEVDTPENLGQHVSVAINPSTGKTYVSYYDATNKALKMAQSGGPVYNCGPHNDWSCYKIVDSPEDYGKYSSIAVDPSGGVGIAYYDATNGKLKYVYYKNPNLSVYTISTIDEGIPTVSTTGLYTSLKFNEDGKPFIAYHFNNPTNVDALVLAYYSVTNGNCGHGHAAGKWQCETIITGEGVGEHTSLVVKNGWDIHIAYYNRGSGDLWYATSIGEGNCGYYGTDWVCYPVTGASGDVGRYASMYVDAGNHFHIAYYDATNKALNYAVDVDSGGNCGVLGSAQCDKLDSMPANYHPVGVSITEDAAGYPIIAYQSESGSLNVARPLVALGLPAGAGNCGPEKPLLTWNCQTIDRAGIWINYRNADYAAITINPAGLATIAYYGFITAADGNLNVSRQLFQEFLPLQLSNH